MDPQLLGPLDVVSLVLDVDTRLVDIEFIEGLNRLEFDESGADQPRDDDVLCHLRVRASSYTERCIESHAVVLDTKPVLVTRYEERGARNSEDRVLLLEFGEHPIRELLHRDGLK